MLTEDLKNKTYVLLL